MVGWSDTPSALRRLNLGRNLAEPLAGVPLNDVLRVWAEVGDDPTVKNRPVVLAYRLAALHGITLPEPKGKAMRAAVAEALARMSPDERAGVERFRRLRETHPAAGGAGRA